MKQILSAAAVAFAFTVCVSAQATPPAQSPAQPNPTKPNTADTQKPPKGHVMKTPATVTLTGCLREGSNPDTFQLENPQVGSTTGSSTPANPPSAAGMPAGDLGAVTLVASPDIDLKPHVGHRVEVRGTMAGMESKGKKKGASTSDTMGSAGSASSSSATGTSGAGKSAAHTLKVRGLNHISDTCSQ